MKELKRKGGSEKVWDPKKGKYVKKQQEVKEVKWVHKNIYSVSKYEISKVKGLNKPYRKNQEEENAKAN